jgi:hypothetical protein
MKTLFFGSDNCRLKAICLWLSNEHYLYRMYAGLFFSIVYWYLLCWCNVLRWIRCLCDVTLSLYPHRAGLISTPGRHIWVYIHTGQAYFSYLSVYPHRAGIFFKPARCGYTLRVYWCLYAFWNHFLAYLKPLLIKSFNLADLNSMSFISAFLRSNTFSTIYIWQDKASVLLYCVRLINT